MLAAALPLLICMALTSLCFSYKMRLRQIIFSSFKTPQFLVASG